MIATYMTDKGSVREQNQDRLQIGSVVIHEGARHPASLSLKELPLLLSVIDGMGGYQGGERAAQILADTLSDNARLLLDEEFSCSDDEFIEKALRKAARVMREEAARDSHLSEMGATVAGLIVRKKSVFAFNCGDCRGYRFSSGYLEKITRDHSIVQLLYDEGEITEEEMRLHPKKNVVTSCVCATESTAINVNTKTVSRCDTDEFFLCCDGVWEMLETKQMEAFLALGGERGGVQIAEALFGGQCRDNVSFIHLAS